MVLWCGQTKNSTENWGSTNIHKSKTMDKQNFGIPWKLIPFGKGTFTRNCDKAISVDIVRFKHSMKYLKKSIVQDKKVELENTHE